MLWFLPTRLCQVCYSSCAHLRGIQLWELRVEFGAGIDIIVESFKKGPKSPDFSHEQRKEVFCSDCLLKPSWVKGDAAAKLRGKTESNGSKVKPRDPSQAYNRMAGLDQARVFVGQKTDGRGRTSTTTTTTATTFEGGQRERVNRNSSGTFEDVWIPCKAGQLKEAMHILNQQGNRVKPKMYVDILQECIDMKDLALGKQVHADLIKSGFKPNIFLLNTLINMYAKCGSMVDARQLFDKMPERDMFSWTMVTAGYVKHGHAKEAFNIYKLMQLEGVTPDRVMFICILNACASLGALDKAKEVHGDVIKAGIASYINLENALVDMYAKCGSMEDACQVFQSMAKRDVISWNTIIAGYSQHGCGWEALNLYAQMCQEGSRPNRVTFICVLNACASLGALEKGMEVHADILKAGIVSYINLENALLDMYAKCGSLNAARLVFNNMAKRNAVSWSSMISGYTQHGCGWEAFKMYEKMLLGGMIPDQVTFVCILNACSSLRALETGKQIHADIIKTRIIADNFLETALVDMYAKCGSLKDAHQVFENMISRNVVSWNALIAGYSQHGCGREAFKIHERMQQEGVTPDGVTFICLLNACASLGSVEKVKVFHSEIIKAGISSFVNLENTLIDVYAKCGSIRNARQVFNTMAQRDVVSWSAMMAGCAQHGCGREVMQLFEQMQMEGFNPNAITFISVLFACSHAGLVDEGRHYFDSMSRDHGLTPSVEHFGCMVDLFSRAGRLDEAEEFVYKMPIKPDSSMCGTLLSACVMHGNVELAERVSKFIMKWDPQDPAAYELLHLC